MTAYRDYFLRCRESRYSILVQRGVRMGVISLVDGEICPVGRGGWDYVGKKALAEGGFLGDLDPYIHVNFRTEFDLREKAMIAAMTDLDIATGMAEIANYFITDAEGHVAAPEIPLRNFA